MKIAVLMLHHENNEGKARGLRSKLDDLYTALRMYRDTDTAASLETPAWIEWDFYRGNVDGQLFDKFQVRFIENAWQVYEPKHTEAKEFKMIVSFYDKNNYDRETIAKMLGICSSTLFKKLGEE